MSSSEITDIKRNLESQFEVYSYEETFEFLKLHTNFDEESKKYILLLKKETDE